MRPWVRRLGLGLAATAGVIGLCAGIGLFWLRTQAGNDWLAHQLDARIDPLLPGGGEVRIGTLRTDLFTTIHLEGLALVDAAGTPLLTVDQAHVTVDWLALWNSEVRLPTVRIRGVVYDDTIDASGTLGILAVLGLDGPGDPDAPLYSGLGIDLSLPDVALTDATVRIRQGDTLVNDLAAITLVGAVHSRGDRLAIGPLVGVERMESPIVFRSAFGGHTVLTGNELTESDLWLVYGGSFNRLRGTLPLAIGPVADATVTMAPAWTPDVGLFTGVEGLDGAVLGELALTGPADALALFGTLAPAVADHGQVVLDASADLTQEMTWSARASIEGLRPAALYADAGDTQLNLVLEGSGSGTRWPEDVTMDATLTGPQQHIVGQDFLESLAVTTSLRDGVLSFSELDVDASVTRVAGSGSINLLDGALDSRLSGPVQLDGLARFGVKGVGGEGVFDLRVRGNFLDDEPVLRVGGDLRTTGASYDDVVRSGTIAGPISMRLDPTRAVLDSELRVTDVQVASAVTLAEVRSPVHAELSLTDWSVEASGHATVTGITDVTDTLEAQGLNGPWNVQVDAEQQLFITADAALQPLSVAGMVSDHGIATLSLDPDTLDLVATLFDDSRTYLDLDASLRLADTQLTVPRLVVAPTWSTTWENEGVIAGRLNKDRIEDVQATITSSRGRLGMRGTIGASGPWDAQLEVDGLQADVAAEYLPEQLGGTSGTIDVVAVLTGDATAPRVQAKLDVQQLWYGDIIQWLDVSGPVTLEDGRLVGQLEVGVADRPIARVDASIPVQANLTGSPGLDALGELGLDVVLVGGALERFAWLLPAATLPDGTVAGHLTARGPYLEPTLALSAVAEVTTPGWTRPARLEAVVGREGTDLQVDVQIYEGLTHRAELTGTATNRLRELLAWTTGAPAPDFNDWTLYADALDVRLSPDGWPLESLLAPPLELLGATLDGPVSGRLHGQVAVQGSPASPRLSADLSLRRGSIGEVPVDSLDLVLTQAPQGYATQLRADFGDEGELEVAGMVPMELELASAPAEDWFPPGLDLVVRGKAPLALLDVAGLPISDTGGRLVLDGTVAGSLLDPEPAIRAQLEDGEMRVDALGLRLSKAQAQAALSADGIRLSSYEVQTSPAKLLLGNLAETTERLLVKRDKDQKSRISGSATISLDNWRPASVAANAKLDTAWLAAMPDEQLQLSGDLRLDGTWPALRATGDVSVDHGFARIDAAQLFVSNPLEPDRRLTIHRMGGMAVREEEAEPLWAPFTAEISVDLGRNLNGEASLPLLDDLGRLGATFSRVEGQARVGGSLVVGLARGVPTARGTLDILGGKASALQSTFDLDGGSVQFIGGPISNPNLDLRASMETADATVIMRVAGTAQDPKVDFTCDEYPEQSQIFTLLLTGQPPDAVGADEGQAAQAVAGLLASSVLGGANLGTIDIQPDGSLRIGVPIDRRLFGSVYLAPLETDVDENTVEVEMEWIVFDNVVLNGTYGNVNSSAELLWEHRF